MSREARTMRLFTVDEYHAMVDAGILDSDDRVELVDGRIVTLAPIGSRHAYAVDSLTSQLATTLRGRAIVRIQNPVTLDDFSEPQPDLSVVRVRDGYREALPSAGDILFLVEVADSSGAEDRRTKMPRYAAAGIAEVLFFDLVAHRLEVHREPQGTTYRVVEIFGADDPVTPAAFPDIVIDVRDVLGPSADG